MNRIFDILHYAAIAMFFFGAVLTYAYVYDLEPSNTVAEYQIERDLYNRDPHCENDEFQSYGDWLSDHNSAPDRFLDKIGQDVADTFEWSRD